MKTLVTGATGFLGREVSRRLRAAGHEVVGVARSGGQGPVALDVADEPALTDLLRTTQPECVINLAAQVDFSEGALSRITAVNSLAPAVIARHCARTNAHLVHASTIAVNGSKQEVYTTNTPEGPDTDYGHSKLMAEREIAASGCAAAILRFAGIFGSEGPEHLGLNKAIAGARRGQQPTVVGNGSARRNYVFVEDAAAMIVRAMDARLTGVFCAAGETQSIREMLKKVCDVWLPGREPLTVRGADARDQIVEASPELGMPRPFLDCLRAIA